MLTHTHVNPLLKKEAFTVTKELGIAYRGSFSRTGSMDIWLLFFHAGLKSKSE